MARFACLLFCLAPAATAAELDDFLTLVTGSFSSATQAARDDRYDHAIWHTVRIWPEANDGAWVYTENWLEGADGPYRQRVSRYRLDADGTILSKTWTLSEPERFVGAWEEPRRFDELTPGELGDESGCVTRLARTGTTRYEGGTVGQACRNAYKGAAYLVSATEISEAGVTNWDRGFDADGKQVWGPAAGGYEFQRQGASICAEPVVMIVYGTIEDRAKFGAYAGAIGASGLYPKNQGYYLGITPAIDVFEGDLPAQRGAVLARFPCAAAARAFWDSPEYAEIRKLREGIAEFEVMLLREPPVPAYVTW
ncbi:MAG: CpcT/CpeT family chromophore lyase [Pseudomonadota bacterium]